MGMPHLWTWYLELSDRSDKAYKAWERSKMLSDREEASAWADYVEARDAARTALVEYKHSTVPGA